jgi:hypothetical protein
MAKYTCDLFAENDNKNGKVYILMGILDSTPTAARKGMNGD